MTVASCSNNAATTALDSMYRTGTAAATTRGRSVLLLRGCRGCALRFATVLIDQFRRRA